MAGLDIPFDIVPVDLGQDKTGPCASHHVKGEFSEEGVDGSSLEGVDE